MGVITTHPEAESGRRRFAAPVRYDDVRVPLNTARAVGGLVIAGASLLALGSGVSGAVIWVIAGLVIAGDGIYRRHHGRTALALVLIDITVFGTAVVLSAHSTGEEAAVFLYAITVSVLLLPLGRAAIPITLAAIWVIPVSVVRTMRGGGETTVTAELIHQGVVALVLTAIVAALLFTAGRSLARAIEHQRRALEAERRAGELKNEFVSMVSHELRTPLTSIAGFTDTLRESWTTFGPAEIDEFLLIMRRETEHLRDLVEDILVIPRLEAGQLRLDLTEIDVRTAVFNSGDAVFTDTGTDFVVTIPGGVQVIADRIRLNQVLRNLLENARKYGGDQVLVEGERHGNLIRVAVSDNGPGVPEDDAERIFEHFEQLTKGSARPATGVGLGLPIARKLVAAMGGNLWYEPRFPTGARFCFTLPVAEPDGTSVRERDQEVTLGDRAPLSDRPQRSKPLTR